MKIQQKICCSFALLFLGSLVLPAQVKTDNTVPAVEVAHQLSELVSPNRVMWSKVVWEYIDFTIPENSDLRTIIHTKSGAAMKQSLFDFLVEEVNTSKNVEVFTNSYFTERMTPNDVKIKLTSIRKKGEYTDTFTVKSDDVYGFMIKGFWYFDKIESKAKYKLLAIAPMGPDIQTVGVQGIDDNSLYELFWIYYPSIRKDLQTVSLLNDNNQIEKIPLDYYLSKRQFKGVPIDEKIINNDNVAFSNSRKGLFQLKKDNQRIDSLLLKKVNSFWYQKAKAPKKADKETLRDILRKKKAYKKEQAEKKVKRENKTK